ncbi:Uncharacterised protein [Vibrio cholerae]|nr:Uncharacterised protein [Vibrio cholerae]CSI55979.1 Uncharacterised protein [Vibrio cholerae]
MSSNARQRDVRVAHHQGLGQLSQRLILRIGIRHKITPLQLNTNRVIIALGSACK